MAKTDPRDFQKTSASGVNSDVFDINIDEGALTATLNDALRGLGGVLAAPCNFGDAADAILIDNIQESTADAGVTIDGLLIKDGAIPSLPIGTTIQPGAIMPCFTAVPWVGWLMLNGDTVGNAGSGATQSDASYEPIYTALWDSISDAWAPVTGGRGASAAADFAALKPLKMPGAADLVAIGAGLAYEAGEVGGNSTVELTEANLAEHTHDNTISQASGSGNNYVAGAGPLDTPTGIATTATGSGEPFSIIPPFLSVYWQIKV